MAPLNGTTTLFAALDGVTGKVLAQCKRRHRQQVVRNAPNHLAIHLMMDTSCTHQHSTVKEWLAGRPRFHLPVTPTYAPWINQVERCFGIVTQQAIRRCSFHSVSVGDLTGRINIFVKLSPGRYTSGPMGT